MKVLFRKGSIGPSLNKEFSATSRASLKLPRAKLSKLNRKSPPNAAQGEDQIIQWLIEVATNPKMAIVYYRMVCFALNELINASRKKSEEEAEKEGIRVRLKLLGKEIQLPAAVTSIEEFLKSISE